MIDPLRDFPLVRDAYRKGIRVGVVRGEKRGEARGEARGEVRGEVRGQAKSLLLLLNARGLAVSSAMRAKILACTDSATLDHWLKNALQASSVSEVINAQ